MPPVWRTAGFTPPELGRPRPQTRVSVCINTFIPLHPVSKLLVLAGLVGGLTRAVIACESCALYIADGADRAGFTASVAHQYTRLGTLWDGAHKTGNPIDQYVDSHITQVGIGYSTGGPWHVQFTLPYIDRAFFRPDHSHTEKGRERGIGDVVLAGTYRLLRTTDAHGNEWQLSVLGGVEFGTGDPDRLIPANHVHHHFVPSGIHEHDLALGSGSTDWLVGADGRWQHGRWFLRAHLQHELRRPGAYGYRFADETSWELGAGRNVVLTHEHSLAVQALFAGDRKGSDAVSGVAQGDTAANIRYLGARLAGTIGMRFSADASVELPVRIRTSDVMAVPDYRIRAAVNWRF